MTQGQENLEPMMKAVQDTVSASSARMEGKMDQIMSLVLSLTQKVAELEAKVGTIQPNGDAAATNALVSELMGTVDAVAGKADQILSIVSTDNSGGLA